MNDKQELLHKAIQHYEAMTIADMNLNDDLAKYRRVALEALKAELEREESEDCEYCQNKCNLCIHKDEETDIGDSWENETIIVDWCSHDYEDYCGDFETDFSYCPKCGRKLG